MLNVSEAYKTAINDVNGRHITSKVKFYFDGPAATPVTFTNENAIVSFELLEEARAETESPLGSIASNELTINLHNEDDKFNPDNVSGPYFGKLKPGTKVELFLMLETAPGVYEEVAMGQFKTSNWNSPSSSMEASVTCYDRLYELCQLTLPPLPVLRKTTLAAMCTMLFSAIGLTPAEYSIDPLLNIPLEYGWFERGTVRQALQSVVVAGSANINVNRAGLVNIESVLRTSTTAVSMADINQVIASDVPQAYYKTYSKVKIDYTTPRLGEKKLLLSIKDVVVPVGGLQLTDIAIEEGPIALVKQVLLKGAKTSTVTAFGYSAWGIDVKISNSAEEEVVTLEVYGMPVAKVATAYTLVDTTPIVDQDKPLELKSQFVQTLDAAKALANTLLKLVRDPVSYVDVECRGNPALEVYDVVTINSPSTNLAAINIMPVRFTYTYDGALSCSMSGIKQAALQMQNWVCVSPGLFINTSGYLFKEG